MALLRNLAISLFKHQRIRTTEEKCRELRRFAEKIITKAKNNDLHSRRLVARDIHDKVVLAKIFDDYVPRYADRPGGYTRMVKMGPRQGDCAAMSIIELVDNNLEFAD